MGDSEEEGTKLMEYIVLVAVIALCIAALAASGFAILASRRASMSTSASIRMVEKLSKRVSRLESILGKALQVLDEVEEASRLKKRRRRRYIAAFMLVEGEPPRDPRLVQSAVEDAVRRLSGEVGLADARPQLVYYDPLRAALIIRTNHLAVNVVLAALLLVERIGGVRVRIVPLRTAGTLRAAKRYLGVLEKLPSRVG